MGHSIQGFQVISALSSKRIKLRQAELRDADTIAKFLQEPEIANDLMNLPFPYEYKHAIEFIKNVGKPEKFPEKYTYAIERLSDKQFLGVLSLHIESSHRRAEVGYWVGKPFWGQGYATEAVARVITEAFENLAINRVFAQCFSFNIASMRVVEKNNMLREGILRQAVYHSLSGEFRDLIVYSILQSDYALQKTIVATP